MTERRDLTERPMTERRDLTERPMTERRDLTHMLLGRGNSRQLDVFAPKRPAWARDLAPGGRFRAHTTELGARRCPRPGPHDWLVHQ
jgi:hypothetical protein